MKKSSTKEGGGQMVQLSDYVSVVGLHIIPNLKPLHNDEFFDTWFPQLEVRPAPPAPAPRAPRRSASVQAPDRPDAPGGAPGPPPGASVGRGRRPRGGGRRHRLGGVRRLREAGKAEERRPEVGRQPVDAEIV